MNFHFVWIPRRRRKVLIGEVATRLGEIIEETASELNLNILAMEIMPDHIHLFVSCPPSIAADQIMFRIKGRSSRILRKEFPHLLKMPSMWTRSYFVSTAGNVSTETIKQYIAEQKKD
jgi:putative transposase